MINLEKKNYIGKVSPPFKKTCPCTVIPPPFLICQIPLPREVIKFYALPFKKSGGWGGGWGCKP